MTENAYDIRTVRYEKISTFTPEMFLRLNEIAACKENDVVLDGGAGYAPVTKALFTNNKDKNIQFHILESSKVQLERSKEELAALHLDDNTFHQKFHFHLNSIEEHNFEDETFSIIILKIVLHELPETAQKRTIRELYRSLKKGGKLIIWQTINNEQTINFFRNVMRKKDELAGFESLVKNRNFITENNLFELFNLAGFKDSKKEQVYDYHFNSKFRLDSEFKNDTNLLFAYNQYLLGMVDILGDEFKEKIKYSFIDQNFSFFLKQGIYTAIK